MNIYAYPSITYTYSCVFLLKHTYFIHTMHKVSIHIHIMWICINFCVEVGTTFLWGIPNSEPMEGPPYHPPYVLIIYRETQLPLWDE